jgi:putative spermidine/putrescine transport system substrate-binding protein
MTRTLLSTVAALALGASALHAQSDDWDAIVAAAKEEGEVAWFVWYFEDRFREFTQAFTEEYGIEVVIPDSDWDTNLDKMRAEAGRESGDIDVIALPFDQLPNVNYDLFQSLAALPEDDGRVFELVGIDGEDKAVAWWGNQTGIAYDPAKVAEADLPQTPEAFATYWNQNPGAFGFNYENGGSGPSFYMSMLRAITGLDFTVPDDSAERIEALAPGIDFFNEHAEHYEITASNADSLTRLSDGEFAMVAAWEDHMAGLQVNGTIRDELQFYIPEMGMFGGGNSVSIPANAENPNAALVFINWLTSPEIQTRFNVEFGTAPMHAEADDSKALVSMEMRARQTIWPVQPFRAAVETAFIDNVILER